MVTVRACVFLLFMAAVVGKSLKTRTTRISSTKPSWYQPLRLARDVMVGGNTSYVISSPHRMRRDVSKYRLLKNLAECLPSRRTSLNTNSQCEHAAYQCAGQRIREVTCSMSSFCTSSCQPVYDVIYLPNKNECFVNTIACECASTKRVRKTNKRC